MIFSVLSAAAVTLVFTRGSIFSWIRKLWPSFFGCPLCIGVWVGVGLWIFKHPLAPLVQGLDMLRFGALVGVTALAGSLVLDVLELMVNALDRQQASRRRNPRKQNPKP